MMMFICGGTCSGKTTLANYLCKHKGFKKIVSCTTRKPRETEKDGVDYHFLSKEQFGDLVRHNKLAEHAKYGENWYGTLKESYLGERVLAVITIDKAVEMRERLLKQGRDARIVYLTVSEEHRNSVYENNDREQQALNSRLNDDAVLEAKFSDLADVVVNNTSFKKSVEELAEIVLSKINIKQER